MTPGHVRHVALFVFVRLAGINGRVALVNVALMRVPPLYSTRGEGGGVEQ